MTDSPRRPISVRLDQRTQERLDRLAQASHETTSDLIRNLVAQALDQEALAHIRAGSRTLLARLDRLEQRLDHALPAAARQLDRITAPVCAVDVHAARRAEVAHAKERRPWNSARWGIWETQGVIKTIMIEALMINGSSYEDALASHDELKEAAGQEFDVYQPKIDADLATLAATGPPPLQPPAPMARASGRAATQRPSENEPGT